MYPRISKKCLLLYYFTLFAFSFFFVRFSIVYIELCSKSISFGDKRMKKKLVNSFVVQDVCDDEVMFEHTAI